VISHFEECFFPMHSVHTEIKKKLVSWYMLKLSYHIVVWFARGDKVFFFFCNVVTTAASDRKTTERSWNYSPTAKWFGRSAIIYMLISENITHVHGSSYSFCLAQKKKNPLNLLTCSRIPQLTLSNFRYCRTC